MTTVVYTNNRLYTGNRPYGDVVLRGPIAVTTTYKALVDTGADYLQLPAAAAALVGISLKGGTLKAIYTAAGTTTHMTLLTGVSVDVEGVGVTVDILFHPSASSRPLLGRQALLRAVQAGFTPTEWLWL